ncbi:hypothetical protein [Rhizobium leguminosarum]|nr:hypothetical protein [Rhizobium leguminosarum]
MSIEAIGKHVQSPCPDEQPDRDPFLMCDQHDINETSAAEPDLFV